MSDEVSWGLSQNHFLALQLEGFRGNEGLHRGFCGEMRCSEPDSDSGRGHVEGQVPARCEAGRVTSLASPPAWPSSFGSKA